MCGRDTRSFSLPGHSSVFSAELVAIYKTLCFIEVSHEALHLILSDSLSSLLALRSFYPCNPLIQDILTRLTSLDRAGKTVKFCWIPSHVGIAGNELADAAARRAAGAPCTRHLPLPARDFYPLSKHSCSPSGNDRGMRKPRTSSDSLNRSSDHGPPASAEGGAMRSHYAGYVLGTHTQRMAISFVARKGPRAPSVRCPSL